MSVGFELRHLIFVLLLFLFLVSVADGQDDPPAGGGDEPAAPAAPPAGGAGESGAAAAGDGGTSTTEDPFATDFDLECYQCIADGTELVPPCDSVFFTSLDSTELKELEFQCPKELPDFCVKKEITYFKSDLKMTFRGCTGKHDELENLLRIGCIRIYDNDTVTEMCFCKTKNCNLSNRLELQSVLTVLCFVAIVLLLLEARNDVAILSF